MKKHYDIEHSDNKFDVSGSHVDSSPGRNIFLDENARARGSLLPDNNVSKNSRPEGLRYAGKFNSGSSPLRSRGNGNNTNLQFHEGFYTKKIITLILALLFVLLITTPGLCADFSQETRDSLLQEYFPDALIARMKADAEPFLKQFDGANIFSVCQYGDRFLVGTVDTGDIFDARIPANMKIFKDYARDNLLIQNMDDAEEYNKYAMASLKFMKELGYDVVLFHPDEFNLIFTKPDDTWMFVREESPVRKNEKYFFSGRMKKRHFAVEGGLYMVPKKTLGFSIYYIPNAGSQYEPFKPGADEIAKETQEGSVYKPVTGTEEMLKKRKELGITPSPLSGRKAVKVGRWTYGKKAEMEYKYGPRFKATGKEYTWGDEGFYVVPLDKDFLR